MKKKTKIREKDLDKAFSRYIRNRDGRCMRCGAADKPLFCMHYHSRVARSVRFNEFNAIAGCYACHAFLETRKTVEHRDLMYKIFGKKKMDEVERAYRRPRVRPPTEAEKQLMLEQWA